MPSRNRQCARIVDGAAALGRPALECERVERQVARASHEKMPLVAAGVERNARPAVVAVDRDLRGDTKGTGAARGVAHGREIDRCPGALGQT